MKKQKITIELDADLAGRLKKACLRYRLEGYEQQLLAAAIESYLEPVLDGNSPEWGEMIVQDIVFADQAAARRAGEAALWLSTDGGRRLPDNTSNHHLNRGVPLSFEGGGFYLSPLDIAWENAARPDA